MSKLTVLAFAAQFAPRLLQVRRGAWIAVAVGLLVLLGLFIWAAVALIGWLFGQASGWLGAARDAAAGPAQGVAEQAKRMVPGARELLDAHLGDYLPAIKAEPVRDVSGEDLGPVSRYPGLARTTWQREEGARMRVEYAGQADYHAVLDHYSRGYAGQGYARSVLSATTDAETHEYAKGVERYSVTVARKGREGVSVRIESTQTLRQVR